MGRFIGAIGAVFDDASVHALVGASLNWCPRGLDIVGSSLNSGGGGGGGGQAIVDERSSTMSATLTLALVQQVQVLWLHLGTTCVRVVAGMSTMLLGGGRGDGMDINGCSDGTYVGVAEIAI